MSAVESYVRAGERGVLRVGSTRVPLDSVVAAFHHGDSPGSIVPQGPLSTLEASYGSITSDLAHRDEVDEDLRRQESVCEADRAHCAANPSPMIERLREIKRARGRSG